MSSRIAIIPARGGSKRIPRKNIKPFLGKPIIAYSIEAAIAAGCFDEVMVSTDDEEIAQVARTHGAQVPFLRTAATANDFSGTAEVLSEVLAGYAGRNTHFDVACCLYPTAPFVTAELLLRGLGILEESAAASVITVAQHALPIWRAFTMVDGELRWLHPEFEMTRSQDLLPTYFDAGQFYWLNVSAFLRERRLVCSRAVPLLLPRGGVQDIDTPEDWNEAEAKYRSRHAPGG
jgi:N-acylneuraminate cytidylyltransferase